MSTEQKEIDVSAWQGDIAWDRVGKKPEGGNVTGYTDVATINHSNGKAAL